MIATLHHNDVRRKKKKKNCDNSLVKICAGASSLYNPSWSTAKEDTPLGNRRLYWGSRRRSLSRSREERARTRRGSRAGKCRAAAILQINRGRRNTTHAFRANLLHRCATSCVPPCSITQATSSSIYFSCIAVSNTSISEPHNFNYIYTAHNNKF